MVYKQDLYTRMFISQKPHKNTKIKYLKYARLLGEFDAKKKKIFFFDLKSFRLTKIYKYKFLKCYKGVPVNQNDLCLPEQKPKIVGHFKTNNFNFLKTFLKIFEQFYCQ